MLLAVNDKNYTFNRTFFNRNLFMWRHLDTSSNCLFIKFFLSACKIVTFSVRQSWHVLKPCLKGCTRFTMDRFIDGVSPASLAFLIALESSVARFLFSNLKLCFWLLYLISKSVLQLP